MVLMTILVLGVFSVLSGLLLSYANERFKVEGNPVAKQASEMLPQMQCGKCGYTGCHVYAEAVVKGEAELNLCTPGGENTMLALAKLLDRTPKPLANGDNNALLQEKPRSVAVIDENICIGCTRCIRACPVDAILGCTKQMHTVIASECTGCELCIPSCPVDCIQIEESPRILSDWKWPYPTAAMLQ